MTVKRRLAVLTAAVLALTVPGAGAAASGTGPRAEKFRLPAALGDASEVIPYGPSQQLLLFNFVEKPGLVRIDNDGSLDRSFGNGGKLDGSYSGVVVAADGKILLAGSGDGDAEVTRLLPDGTADPSFGRGGTARLDFGGAYDRAKTVAVIPNGDIVVVGTRQTIVDNRGLSDAGPAIGRLLPNGEVDRSFGEEGQRTLAGGWESGVANVVPLRGGGIVATGEGYLGLVVWKLTATGQPNRHFGNHGVLNLDESHGRPESLSWVNGVAALPSGKLLLAATGERFDGSESHYRALALRLKANGRVDRSFGRRGWASATFGGDTLTEDLMLLPHGILVLVANAHFRHDKESDLGAVAFNRRGRLYRGFGHRGRVRVDLHRWDLVEDAAARGGHVVILGRDHEGEGWLVGVPKL